MKVKKNIKIKYINGNWYGINKDNEVIKNNIIPIPFKIVLGLVAGCSIIEWFVMLIIILGG